MTASTLDEVDVRLRDIISSLYTLLVQLYDHQGERTKDAIIKEMKLKMQTLLDTCDSAKRLPTHIPIELIQYVEETRNPDIYTREFMELVMRYNQQQKGRSEAFASFRDILAEQMMVGIPDIKEDVRQVWVYGGGRPE